MASLFRHAALLSAALLSALALSGCGEAPGTASDEIPPVPTSPGPAGIYTPPSPDASQVVSAIPRKYRANQSFRSCAAAAINACAANAVSRTALGTLDPADCDAIPVQNLRGDCRTQVATEAAVKGKDLGKCVLAGTGGTVLCATEAARRLAVETADPAWCGKFGDVFGSGAGIPTKGASAEDACRYAAGASVTIEKAPDFCAALTDKAIADECAKMTQRRAQMTPPPTVPGAKPEPSAKPHKARPQN